MKSNPRELSIQVDDQHQFVNGSIQKATMIGMIVFSVGYMISEPNLDGFNLQEALEYMGNAHLESIPVHMAGFVTSFVANVPLLSTIIYCWMKHANHDDEHDHSKLQELIEFLAIGGPFALMGSAAYLATLNELVDGNELTLLQTIFAYTGALISGSITGFGAYKLHGFHVHDAMEENGGGVSGFLKGIYTTFIKNVWAAKDEYESLINKTLAVFHEIWKKYGIVVVHGYLGNFAANVFLKQTGINNRVPLVDTVLKIFLPIAVMLYEGNTEARSLDTYKDKENNPVSYSLYSKLVVMLSGILHTIPSITALAIMMGSSKEGPGDGKLYNSLTYLAAGLILAYPSIYGFMATTITGFDQAAKGLGKKLKDCLGWQEKKSNYKPIDRSEQSACSKVLSLCGFFKRHDPEDEHLNLFVYGRSENSYM